jgi:VWFA-related protein
MNGRLRLCPAHVLCSLAFLPGIHSTAQEAKEPEKPPFTIEANVNRVLVPVVVRDQQGRTVGDLKREDFQVFDNGKARLVSAVTVERRGASESNQGSNTESGAQPPALADAMPPSPRAPKRFTVLLFDDMNLSFEDLAYAKKAGVKALDGALVDLNIAVVVSTSGKVNSGWTRDRAKLQDAIMSLQTQALYRLDETECPKVDYYQADQIVNQNDDAALGEAVGQIVSCHPDLAGKSGQDPVTAIEMARSAARRVLSLGSRDIQATYATMAEIVRRMAALPGQRILILVSSGLPQIEQELLTGESQIVDLSAQSNVTISALDARGIYTTSLTASDHSTQGNAQFRRSAMARAGSTMADLANGTGGTFFHDNNDLDAGFKSLIVAPEVVYVLELSLDKVKPDGHYHSLKVKVDRESVQLQARRGYFIPKPEKTKK